MDWALFFSAFLSSTLLPGSSEAMLLLKLGTGGDPMRLVLVATLGNLLGSLLTYWMGRAGNHAIRRRWLGIDDRILKRAEDGFRRWGWPSLLLAWLPVVGDPLCFIAGLLRMSLLGFTLLVGLGKLGRYALLAVLVT